MRLLFIKNFPNYFLGRILIFSDKVKLKLFFHMTKEKVIYLSISVVKRQKPSEFSEGFGGLWFLFYLFLFLFFQKIFQPSHLLWVLFGNVVLFRNIRFQMVKLR